VDGEAMALVCEGQPPTANNRVRDDGRAFLDRVRAGFAATGAAPRAGLLYGVLYWFARPYRPHVHPDATT
jgi:hypothetical protein